MSALCHKRTSYEISSDNRLSLPERPIAALVRCVFTDPDFVPFEPPERPLGLLGLRTLLRNYIETIPRPAYEQSITRIRTRLSDVLIVSDPNIFRKFSSKRRKRLDVIPQRDGRSHPSLAIRRFFSPRARTGAGNGAQLLQFSDMRRCSHSYRSSRRWRSVRLSAGAQYSVQFQ